MLDRVADVAEMLAGRQFLDAEPHALEGHLGQALRLDAGLADEEHPAGVAVEAVLDHGDVDVDGVAGLQPAIAGNAVADDMIDGGADRFREAAVVQRRRDRALDVGDVVVADTVQFVGRDAGLDIISDHVEHVGRQAAGNSHLVLLVGSLDRYVHRIGFCQGPRRPARISSGYALLAATGYGIKRAP